MSDDLALALDFGGTKLSAGLFGADSHTLVGRRSCPSPATASQGLADMLALARSLLAAAAGRLVCGGVSFGGLVDAGRGVVRRSQHISGWDEMPLAAILRDELGVPVGIDNDASAGALGEWRFGCGRGTDSLGYVTVSTGVGAGLVLGGRVWNGHDGLAGEIGHLLVRPDGPRCSCGRAGCVEAIASGSAIAAAYGVGDGEAVARAADTGDPAALEVLANAGEALGLALRALVAVANPERIAIGGGVAKAGPALWEPMLATLRMGVLARAEVVPAELGDDAPLWGALALGLGVRR